MVEVFFFSCSGVRLYGAYHVPAHRANQEYSVLLCSAFGNEGLRSRHACRVLGERLARSGVPCLRFDYRGTGDSAGDTDCWGVKAWVEDICIASRDVQNGSGAKKLILVGVRLGASLAWHAVNTRGLAAVLIMWDPVLDGKRYVYEMLH